RGHDAKLGCRGTRPDDRCRHGPRVPRDLRRAARAGARLGDGDLTRGRRVGAVASVGSARGQCERGAALGDGRAVILGAGSSNVPPDISVIVPVDEVLAELAQRLGDYSRLLSGIGTPHEPIVVSAPAVRAECARAIQGLDSARVVVGGSGWGA